MRTLQMISGFWFFVLGSLMLAAYVSLRGELFGPWPAWTLQYTDLPFILAGLIYGSVSLVRSVEQPGKSTKAMKIILGILVVILFSAACVMDVWKAA